MMKRKFLSMLLCQCMAVGLLAGCGSKNEKDILQEKLEAISEMSETEDTVLEQTEIPPEPEVQGYTVTYDMLRDIMQRVYDGMDLCKRKKGNAGSFEEFVEANTREMSLGEDNKTLVGTSGVVPIFSLDDIKNIDLPFSDVKWESGYSRVEVLCANFPDGLTYTEDSDVELEVLFKISVDFGSSIGVVDYTAVSFAMNAADSSDWRIVSAGRGDNGRLRDTRPTHMVDENFNELPVDGMDFETYYKWALYREFGSEWFISVFNPKVEPLEYQRKTFCFVDVNSDGFPVLFVKSGWDLVAIGSKAASYAADVFIDKSVFQSPYYSYFKEENKNYVGQLAFKAWDEAVLDYKLNGITQVAAEQTEDWKKAYLSALSDGTIPVADYVMYSLSDITKDGIPELIIYDDSIYGTGIYTVSNNKVVTMLYEPGDVSFDVDALILSSRYVMAVYKINSDSLEQVFYAERDLEAADPNVYIVDGQTLDYEGCLNEAAKYGIDINYLSWHVSSLDLSGIKSAITSY